MYLHPDTIDDTSFPQGTKKDFFMAVRLTAEKWKRMFPPLPYECIIKDVQPVADPDTPSGTSTSTNFDVLYGESIDDVMNFAMGGEGWEQPHGNDEIEAVAVEKYEEPLHINLRVQREAKDSELKKYGFDEVRDLLVVVPLSLLDEQGIRVKHGDRFEWNDERFIVKEFNTGGYWKNTNLTLFMIMNCDNYRPGA